MHNQTIDPTAPEWASRLLKIRETAVIVGENPATVYRKIDAGIYPAIVRFGSSSRIRGWELWSRLKRPTAERTRDEA
jgi:predicted DNA-binding transcriptional regulator AlpA